MRGYVEQWELDARQRTEAMRQILASLLEQERALDAGEAKDESFQPAFARAVELGRQTTLTWLPQWISNAESSRFGLTPAFQVFVFVITTLCACVDMYARCLAIFATSPDLFEHRNGASESDGELAGRALGRCQDVAAMALALAEDTPSLKKRDAAKTQELADGFKPTYQETVSLAEHVRQRLEEITALPD